VRAYVALGANLGDPLHTLAAARDALAALPGTRLQAVSSWWRSAPVDAAGPDFINGVVALDTSLEPLELLDALQAIEHAHGRTRPHRHAPRTLDLDLLMHGDNRVANERLTLPHPRLARRAFVLAPLLEVAPELKPRFGAALTALADQHIERFEP
jgi:2-amino-4-hydroxy-6-hydroxymethyldihydropteridine diphosphokinase